MTEPIEERQTRPFADFLAEQRDGKAHAEITNLFNELIEAVQAHSKAGSLTLQIRVKPAGRGSEDTVFVSDEVSIKKPKGERPEAIFFVDDSHNLQRNNPRQERLPLREVPKPATELKEVRK